MTPKAQLVWSTIVSLLIAGIGVLASVLVGVMSATPSVGSYGLAIGEACLDYEAWVLARIGEGMTDVEIAELTMYAITATGGSVSPFSTREPRDEAFIYEPCLIENMDQALAFVATLRAASSSPD